MNIFLAGSINMVAAFMEHAQIIALLPCMAFKFPSFMKVFFHNLRKINLMIFDVEDEKKWYKDVFGQKSLK